MRRLILKVCQQKQEASDALEVSQRALHDTEELLEEIHQHIETTELMYGLKAENKTETIRALLAKIKLLWEKLT